jgi:hypothetical protein
MRVVSEEPEVFDHRVGRIADFAGDTQRFRLCVGTFEFDALPGFVKFDAIQPAEKIEMPELAAELSVGSTFQPDCLLFRNQIDDGLILGRLQLFAGDCATLVLCGALP